MRHQSAKLTHWQKLVNLLDSSQPSSAIQIPFVFLQRQAVASQYCHNPMPVKASNAFHLKIGTSPRLHNVVVCQRTVANSAARGLFSGQDIIHDDRSTAFTLCAVVWFGEFGRSGVTVYGCKREQKVTHHNCHREKWLVHHIGHKDSQVGMRFELKPCRGE